MERLIKRLYEGNFSCVVANGNETRVFVRPGIIDLYELQKQDGSYLRQAKVADKVVGKAAAALMVLGGVSKVYAGVVSISALALLRNTGVEVEFAEVVPFIKNKSGSDWCPVEQLCSTVEELTEVYSIIEDFIKRINSTI